MHNGLIHGALASALGLMIASCGDDTACDSAGCESASDTASSSASESDTSPTSGPTSGASETGTTSSGSASASASEGTTMPTSESDATSATSATDSSSGTNTSTDSGLTDGSTSSTTGPTCEDECIDGVCVGDICCPVDDACGDQCCAEGQLCSFGSCFDPGNACVSASDCEADSYCDYSLGMPGDKICGGGGTPDTGLCIPLPVDCEPGEEPDDLETLDCLPQCTFNSDLVFEADLKHEWTGASVMMPPIIAQLDDDNCDDKIDGRDIPDIIWSSFAGGSYNNNGTLHVYSVIDGTMTKKWSVNPQSNRIWPGKALAAADLDGVPGAEIVACTEGGRARAFHPDGSDYWSSLGIAYCDMPAIADFDSDGKPEILLAGTVLDGQSGAVKATFPVKYSPSWWRERVLAADIDDDGTLEIVSATRAFEADGTMIADTGLSGTFPAIADLDLDGKPEVVVIANLGKGKYVHDLHVWRYDTDTKKAVVIRQNVNINGTLNPALCSVNSNGYSGGGGPPTVAQFNGDGRPDVGVAGGVGYAVFDGAKLVDENVANADTLLWSKQTQDCSSSFTGSSVYDFDGDGRAEVVYGDEEFLRIYRGFDGKILSEICNTSGTLHEYPLIADVDSDGHADIIAASNNYSSFACPGNIKTTGVRVFSNPRWTRTRKIWNQHTYHVTNIDDDGNIPTTEANNWSTPGLNNYRQNYIDNIFAAPDVVIASVWPECGGDYGLYARVRNIGEQAIPSGVKVDFYSGDPEMGGILVGTAPTTKELYPAEAEDVFMPLPDAPADLLDGSELGFAVVNADAKWLECRPSNNTAEGSGLCE